MIQHYYSKAHRRRIGVAPYDVDAQIYFDAVIANGGALLTLEKDAYNVYRIDSKNNADAWNGDCHLDYPMIGGTVESMVINAKNPGTFDATAINTVSGDFTANGFLPSTGGYFVTGFIPSAILTIDSIMLEAYVRNNVNVTQFFWSSRNGNDQLIEWALRKSGNSDIDCYSISDGRLRVALADCSGGMSYSRRANNDAELYRKGTSIGTSSTGSGSLPNKNMSLGGRIFNFTITTQVAGALIGDSFTSLQVLAQYNARQLFNTNCVVGGRQV